MPMSGRGSSRACGGSDLTLEPKSPSPISRSSGNESTARRSRRKPTEAEKKWEERTLAPTLAKSPERAQEFTTVSSYPIRRLYTPADLPDWDEERDLGLPGEPPYARGIHATMYRGRLWTMRQFAGFGSAADTNQ